MNRALKAAKTQYQPYTGELVAGINSQEQAGINATNQLQGTTSGLLGQASGYAQGSTAAVDPSALDASAISKYENPYKQDVINSTLATINNQNRQQAEGLTSGLISSGAFGGDRAGVAQAALAGQQDLATNQTIAGLNSQNYSQALSTAQQQQATKLSADQANRAALAQGAQLYEGLGSTASSTGIANANAQLQAGLLQQQTQQAQDTANYGQFEQQQAYPFQTAQFLSGITGSLAPELGGTSNGYSQSSPPNPLNSILGGALGIGALALRERGGRVEGFGDCGVFDLAKERERRARGGLIEGLGNAKRYADGGLAMSGMPYADAPSYVPLGSNAGLGGGHPVGSGLGLSAMPQSTQPTATDPGSALLTKGIGMLGGTSYAKGLGDSFSDAVQDAFARGGTVRGYDGGGVVPDADALTFDPSALGAPPPAGLIQGLGSTPSPAPTGLQEGLGGLPAPPSSSPPLQRGVVPTRNLGDPPEPVPVAAAPNVTPVVGYRSLSDTVPSNGSGLGAVSSAPAAIDHATAPRSVRNNNPGNIVDGKYAQGLPGYAGSDGRFARFETPEAGTSAMDGLLSSYGRQGLTTPLQIISKWSPAGDGNNDPVAYAGTVAKTLGIGLNDPIDMSDPAQRARLGKAMAGVEAGTARGGLPSSAMGYAGGTDGGGLQKGLVAPSTSGLGSLAGAPQNLAGKLGLGDIHIGNDASMALLAAGLGTMASPSRSVGQAIGEGGLKGVAQYTQQQKLGQENQRIALALKEFQMNLDKAHAEIRNYGSEDNYRKGMLANEGNRISLERFELVPGPDGSYRYLDKLNPGAGLLTSGQLPSGVAASLASGVPTNGAPQPGVAPSNVAAPPAGAPPAAPMPNGLPSAASPSGGKPPTQLDSSSFVKTGNPTLRAPDGYVPENYWMNTLRARHDPVVRDTLARQSVEDVADANKRATKAYSSMYYSDQMDRSIAGLPQNGLLAPGAAFNERLALTKNWNAIAGLVPGMAHMTVDENAVAKGEGLIKDKTRLGADLTSALGSREAASVFSSMMAAVPGGDNTRAGYKNISSAIRALSQREIDHNAFMQDWSSRYGNTNGAEIAFNQMNPPTLYAHQAETLARIPQRAVDLLRSNSNDPNTIANFERVYGRGTARYYTGQFAQ